MLTRIFISPGLWRLTAASATVLLMGASAGYAQGYKPRDFALEPGDAVVTGFSGIVPGAAQPFKKAAAQADAEEMFIDLGGASMVIVKAGVSGRPPIPADVTFEVTAGEVGQVFPIALGKRRGAGADIYLGATSLFGLQIVLPDSDGDGRPERTRTGHPNADWMQGQFGTENGSGPGSIWKVDGATGEVSLFAHIDENSGPGIGDIVRHPRTGQLYASDLDTGLVHRIGDDGALIDAYDHGMAALGDFGGQALADDGKVADIKDSGFDSDDPGTWGLTQSARRVWGMAIRGDRLFYAVADGAEIWSVGLNADGSFSSDIRPEIDIEPGEEPLPITDMVFGADGSLYAAQRGFTTGGFDTSIFADNKDAKVLRFVYDDRAGASGSSPWQLVEPDVTGPLPQPHLLSGGIDLRTCQTGLWSTADPEVGSTLKGGAAGEPLLYPLGRSAGVSQVANDARGATLVTFNNLSAAGTGDVEVLKDCEPVQQAAMVVPVHGPASSHWRAASRGPGLVPVHSRYASDGGGHSVVRSHWRYASDGGGHSVRRSHWKWASPGDTHSRGRSHWKWASPGDGHSLRRSHWKKTSPGDTHSIRRSHWKKASPGDTHSLRRSHWKKASPGDRHSIRRSHWKKASPDGHNRIRSHWKKASPGDGHSLQRSHWKRSSPGGHSNTRSHLKHASPGDGHGRIRSHLKSGSPGNGHSVGRSHSKHGSPGQGHRRAISQAVLDRPKINRVRPTDFRVKRFDPKPFEGRFGGGGGNFRPMPRGDFKQR